MRKYNFTYLYNSSTVSWTVLGSVFTECEGIRLSLRSHKTDHGKWLSSGWAYGRKCENASSLSSTTAWPFHKWCCGVSSWSVKVFDQVQDHTKLVLEAVASTAGMKAKFCVCYATVYVPHLGNHSKGGLRGYQEIKYRSPKTFWRWDEDCASNIVGWIRGTVAGGWK